MIMMWFWACNGCRVFDDTLLTAASRAASDGGLREVSSRRMKTIIRHDDVIWATHCYVKSKTPTPQDGKAFHVDTQSMMDRHGRV